MVKWGTLLQTYQVSVPFKKHLEMKFRKTAIKVEDIIVFALLLGSYIMSTFKLYNYLLNS